MTFEPIILVFLAILIVWSGFIRSAFGFGGNALMLPLALLVIPDPLVIIPIVIMQAVIFNGLEVMRQPHKVAWKTVFRLLAVMALPFVAGVYGLIQLPSEILALGVYIITLIYALSYIFPMKLVINSKIAQFFSLILGGYVTGFSFAGGPPVVAVAAKHIPKQMLRNSLMALWVVAGSIKLVTLSLANVDLQIFLQLFTLPAAIIGHIIGNYYHNRIVHVSDFYRIIGVVLLLVSMAGIAKAIL